MFQYLRHGSLRYPLKVVFYLFILLDVIVVNAKTVYTLSTMYPSAE